MEIVVDHVSAEIGGRSVLRDVSFRVGAGERVVLLGVNGCGKTTLLKLLNGLLFPTSGRIFVDGVALDRRVLDGDAFRVSFRRRQVLLFQSVDAMLFNPTVTDEIAFGPRQLGLTDVDARVERWARTFELLPFLDRAPFELSGGEKKRVALASVFALEPEVALLDEPTASFDPAAAAQLVDFLAAQTGLTVLASTHNLSAAEELGGRAVLLGRERAGVLYDGPTSRLLADDDLLIESGLAHRHVHEHGDARHAHFHVHDLE